MCCNLASGRQALVLPQTAQAARVIGWQQEAELVFIKRWGEKDAAVTEIHHVHSVHAVLTF